jgi:hypothetical protein
MVCGLFLDLALVSPVLAGLLHAFGSTALNFIKRTLLEEHAGFEEYCSSE